MRCVVLGCPNKKNKKKPGVSFHTFPKNETLRAQWFKAVGRENLNPAKNHYTICSDHFPESDFDRASTIRVFLKPNTVPSIFKTFSQDLPKVKQTTKPVSKEPSAPNQLCPEPTNSESVFQHNDNSCDVTEFLETHARKPVCGEQNALNQLHPGITKSNTVFPHDNDSSKINQVKKVFVLLLKKTHIREPVGEQSSPNQLCPEVTKNKPVSQHDNDSSDLEKTHTREPVGEPSSPNQLCPEVAKNKSVSQHDNNSSDLEKTQTREPVGEQCSPNQLCPEVAKSKSVSQHDNDSSDLSDSLEKTLTEKPVSDAQSALNRLCPEVTNSKSVSQGSKDSSDVTHSFEKPTLTSRSLLKPVSGKQSASNQLCPETANGESISQHHNFLRDTNDTSQKTRTSKPVSGEPSASNQLCLDVTESESGSQHDNYSSVLSNSFEMTLSTSKNYTLIPTAKLCSLKRQLEEANASVVHHKKKIKLLQQKCRRYEKRVTNLKSLLKGGKNKGSLSNDLDVLFSVCLSK